MPVTKKIIQQHNLQITPQPAFRLIAKPVTQQLHGNHQVSNTALPDLS
jgi:hypothetical protein